MEQRDYTFWTNQQKEIEYLTSQAVGFSVTVYWISSALSGIGNENSYQIMPAHDDIVPAFWQWHLIHNSDQQEFETPIEAAVAFVKAWNAYQQHP